MPNNEEIGQAIDSRAEALTALEQNANVFTQRAGTPIPLAQARYHFTQVII